MVKRPVFIVFEDGEVLGRLDALERVFITFSIVLEGNSKCTKVLLERGPHGKPVLAEPVDGLHFSSSSSADLCLIALTGAGPVGIDVERVAPRTRLERIAETRFAPEEAEAILSLDGEARLRAFYNCWTRKEAYLKATGAGLTAPLDRVVVSVGDERPAILALEGDDPADWRVASLEPRPGFVAAVVWRAATR